MVPAPATISVAAPVLHIVEHIREELAQEVNPNADNLSAARRPVSTVKEPTIFVTMDEVEALFRREKEKASSIAAFLRLKPP